MLQLRGNYISLGLAAVLVVAGSPARAQTRWWQRPRVQQRRCVANSYGATSWTVPVYQTAIVLPGVEPVAPQPAEPFAVVPIFPKTEPVPPITVAATPLLTPGARPITIMVSFAPRDVVARSVVSWGFADTVNHTGAGRQAFGPEGGVALGEIPADASPATVKVTAMIDYVNPDIPDLEHVFTPAVGASGVQVLVPTTANTLKQHFILKSRVAPHLRDVLIVEFEHRATDPASGTRRGHLVFACPNLLRAEQTLLDHLLELPVKPDAGGTITWRLTGTLGGRSVEAQTQVPADQAAVTVVINQDYRIEMPPSSP